MGRNRSRSLGASVLVVALVEMTLPAGASALVARPAAAPAHPFPAHVTYQVGVVPSASQASKDAAVEAAYNRWKGLFLTTGCGSGQYRVVSPDVAPNATVSEGQGYGMNIVPLMAGYDANAQTEFNGLWSFVQAHEDQYGLMQWDLNGNNGCRYGGGSGTPDSATDGDIDIGYGLILADKQWGGFTSAAKTWLGRVFAHDVDSSSPFLDLADDTPGSGNTFGTRPSDYMLDHLRAFAAYDTAHNWNSVIAKTQSVLTQFSNTYSPNTGLQADFEIHANTTSPSPAPPNYLESQYDGISSYNSLRVPWHMGTDALEFNNSVSLGEARHLDATFRSSSGDNGNNIWPTNQLNGTPTDKSGGQCICSTSAVGPSAMAAGDQSFTDSIWNFITTNDNPYGDSYYGYTIRVLSEIVMASDWWNPLSGSVGNDFSVSVSPTSATVAAGSSTTASVSTAVTQGSSESVALSASAGVPAGGQVSFSPSTVGSGSGSTMTVTTSSSTAAGTYPITVTGTASSGSHSVTFTLTVTGGGGGSGGTFEAEARANTLANGAVIISCPSTCSGGARVGYIGNPGTLTINNVVVSTAGTYAVTLAYTDGEGKNLTASISVNGGTAKTVTVTPTANYDTVADTTVNLALAAGTNSIMFSNPSADAPDVDKIVVPSSPGGGGGNSINMYITLYGFNDNSPPGCAIAYPQIHSCAGGTGTYADPITYATDQAELAAGTIVYYAPLRRYFIMEDDCVACDQDWTTTGPDGGPGYRHIDLWAGGAAGDNATALNNCEAKWTSNGQVPVIVNPPSNEPVSSGSIFNPSTSTCY